MIDLPVYQHLLFINIHLHCVLLVPAKFLGAALIDPDLTPPAVAFGKWLGLFTLRQSTQIHLLGFFFVYTDQPEDGY